MPRTERRTMWRPCAATLLLALAIAPRLSSADTPELRLLFVGDAAPFSSVGARGAAEGYVVTLCERIATALRPGRSPSWRETAIADGLDSTWANPRQKDSNNHVGNVTVMRRANRRHVGWLCRRGGMRFPACWAAGDGQQAYGGIGCWQVAHRAVCGRTEIAAQPVRLWE